MPLSLKLRDLKLRKVRPATAKNGPPAFSGERMAISVSYAITNGEPLRALLLPVVKSTGRWRLRRPDGQPAESPVSQDLPDLFFGTAQADGQASVRVEADWPAPGIAHCLLVLLHPQLEAIGDVLFRHQILRDATLKRWLPRTEGEGLLLEHGLAPVEIQLDTRLEVDTPDMVRLAVLRCLGAATSGQLDVAVVTRKLAGVAPLARPGAGPERGMRTGEHPPAAGAGLRPLLREAVSARGRGLAPFAETEDTRAATALAGKGAAIPRGDSGAAAAPATTPPAGATFALTSCLYPAGLLDGPLKAFDASHDLWTLGPAHQALGRLARRLQAGQDVAALVVAGDQVYVDATAGLFAPGVQADHLRLAYRRLQDDPARSLVFEHALAYRALLDDHEIQDNWDGPDGSNAAELAAARDAYLASRRQWPTLPDAPPEQLWAPDELAGFAFFFTDTRTERERRTQANWQAVALYGPRQAAGLQAWIRQQAGRGQPAFVVSPAMLVPRPLLLQSHPAMALHVDAWSGFPHSFHQLLVELYDAQAGNLVFLSGDEHLSCVARLRIEEVGGAKPAVDIISVHSSAAYAPFAFANSREADFPGHEAFGFGWQGRRFACEAWVDRWCAGDGFALLTPWQHGDGTWSLRVEFDRADGTRVVETPVGAGAVAPHPHVTDCSRRSSCMPSTGL